MLPYHLKAIQLYLKDAHGICASQWFFFPRKPQLGRVDQQHVNRYGYLGLTTY